MGHHFFTEWSHVYNNRYYATKYTLNCEYTIIIHSLNHRRQQQQFFIREPKYYHERAQEQLVCVTQFYALQSPTRYIPRDLIYHHKTDLHMLVCIFQAKLNGIVLFVVMYDR